MRHTITDVYINNRTNNHQRIPIMSQPADNTHYGSTTIDVDENDTNQHVTNSTESVPPVDQNSSPMKPNFVHRMKAWFYRYTTHDEVNRASYWKPVYHMNDQSRSLLNYPRTQGYGYKSIISAYLLNYAMIILIAVLYAVMALVAEKPELAFHIDDIALKYPDEPEIVSNALSTVYNVVICAAILILFQVVVRNFHDFHHAAIGFAFAIFLQGFMKSFLWVNFGDLRPDLLSKCQIQQDKLVPGQSYYYPSEICQPGLEINTPGWPSGHASQAAVCWVFIALYLNAKLKPFDNGSHIWKFIACWVAPLLMPIYISLSRVRDFSHYPYQVGWGFALGVLTAIVAYRMMYCSLFGWDNHIPTYYQWISKWRLTRQRSILPESRIASKLEPISQPSPSAS